VQGAFGRVLRVRKRDGGADYAAKVLLAEPQLRQAAPFSFDQLSELKALFKARARARRGEEGPRRRRSAEHMHRCPPRPMRAPCAHAGEERLASV
jgi:hypothetical protein